MKRVFGRCPSVCEAVRRGRESSKGPEKAVTAVRRGLASLPCQIEARALQPMTPRVGLVLVALSAGAVAQSQQALVEITTRNFPQAAQQPNPDGVRGEVLGQSANPVKAGAQLRVLLRGRQLQCFSQGCHIEGEGFHWISRGG